MSIYRNVHTAVGTLSPEQTTRYDAPLSYITMRSATLCMMSALGELAAFAAEGRLPDRCGLEHDAVSRILGKLAASLAIVGECCRIDLQAAANRYAASQKNLHEKDSAVHRSDVTSVAAHDPTTPHKDNERHEVAASTLPSGESKDERHTLSSTMLFPASSRQPAASTLQRGRPAQQTSYQTSPSLVHAHDDEAVKGLTRHDAHLYAPNVNFCQSRCQDQRRPDSTPPTLVVPCLATNALDLKSRPASTPQPRTTAAYDASSVAAFGMPTAQKRDLVSAATQVETTRVKAEDGNDSGLLDRDNECETSNRQTNDCDSARFFYNLVEQLRRGTVSERQLSRLGLTFSAPDDDGRLVELVPNGRHIAVTAMNVDTFLRMLDHRPTSHASSAQPHSSKNVRRLEVVNELAEESTEFSPSHFTYGLFAPYQPSAAVYVDYDEKDGMLPPALRATEPSSQQPSAKPDAVTLSSPYIQAVIHGDMATLAQIIRHVQRDVRALRQYGVTYAVPSRLEPYATTEERVSGLHALFPGSTYTLVKTSDSNTFLALVRQYFKGFAC